MRRTIARSHLLRHGRVDVPGQIYLVTTRTAGRAPLLADLSAARATIRALRETEALGLANTLAFVVMPDHLHWLLQLGRYPMAAALRCVKGRAAREINARHGRSGAVWQSGYHDHALRREESLVECARYLLLNPVRAGLVSTPREWPHWFINKEAWPLLAADLDT